MRRRRSPRLIALAWASVYALLGALWIVGSDEAVALLAQSPGQLTHLQNIKGWTYVGITAVLAYCLVRSLLWRAGRLRAQDARHGAILGQLPVGVALIDLQDRCLQANPELHRLLDASPGSLPGENLRKALGLDAERWQAAHREPQALHWHVAGGTARFLRLTIVVGDGAFADADEHCASVLMLQDVSAAHHDEERARLAAVAFETRQPILITDAAGTILRANRAYLDLTGYSAEELLGQNPRLFGSDRQDAEFYQRMWQALTAEGYWEGELVNRRRDGELYPKWESITAVHDASGRTTHYVAHALDLSERREIERAFHQLQNFDRLTGLCNRNHLLQQIEQIGTAGEDVLLLLLDIDSFRAINDALGLARGDALLREVADLLGRIQPQPEWRARISADVFAIVTQQDEQRCIAQLRHGLNHLPTAQSIGNPVTACYGSCHLAGESEPAVLLARAEAALHHAKTQGADSHGQFDPDMQSAAEARLARSAQLRRALQRGSIVAYFQIQVDDQDRIVGAEALARWEKADGGLVPPAVFIPLAEELGLSKTIGERMLSQVAALSARLTEAGRPLQLSVNLSAQHLREVDFVERTLFIVGAAGARPEQITLEVTESLVVEDFGTASARLDALRAAGFRIAIDDFGTGYSSLSYLRQLPIDELKIDGSFLRDAMSDNRGALLFESVVAIGHTLGLSVVAEGVETDAQAALARGCGDVVLQGWRFGRAEPTNAFLRRLGIDGARRRRA